MNPSQDHFDHIREVAGINHVGIGADSTYPLIMNTLTNRGRSSPDLEQLRSGNILRFLCAAEDVAEKK